MHQPTDVYIQVQMTTEALQNTPQWFIYEEESPNPCKNTYLQLYLTVKSQSPVLSTSCILMAVRTENHMKIILHEKIDISSQS